jgi:CheY-like chemotaxis protein
MFNKIPFIYYQTKVLFIDDNKPFLDSIDGVLNDSNNLYFNNTADAESFISSNNIFNLKKYLFESQLDISYDKKNINIDIGNIKNMCKDITRYNTISVVVVDYDLGKKNGLEFLESIKLDNVFKILLTGKADEKIAIDAFSKGLINSYIQKSAVGYMQKLITEINKGKIQFFINECNPIMDIVLNDNIRDYAQLDVDFISHFWNVFKNQNITEFYINI